MAWRPTEYFVEGILDNTVPGKVTGWMKFIGKKKIIFNLEGNFHRDIRGAKVRLSGDGKSSDFQKAKRYLECFSTMQTGKVGDMTSGREPYDYGKQPYFEWYGKDNGRIVVELDSEQVELLTSPIPFIESDLISRTEQHENMGEFLNSLASNFHSKKEEE